MPECVGNYSIPTENGNVEGADTLAGAGIVNFLNIYVQQTPVLLIILLALQPTVGFSLLSDFLPFRPFLTQLSPLSYSHYL